MGNVARDMEAETTQDQGDGSDIPAFVTLAKHCTVHWGEEDEWVLLL